MVTHETEQLLLKMAHDAIAHGLTHGYEIRIEPKHFAPPLQELRATFVTLSLHGELRGCIGSLEAHQPLILDVIHNAYAAAFSDPRFAPLTTAEFRALEIHISILNPAEEMQFSSEEDLIAQLRPNVDGLILTDGRARGTFLPSVWEQLPDPHQFFIQLKRKAGLPANHWSEGVRVKRYTTHSFP